MTWEKRDDIIDQMIKGSNGELWGKTLEQTDHFPIMQKALSHIDKSLTMIDIGCGAGDVSKFWDGDYIGVDLDWVVEGVSKVRNPNKKFLSINVIEGNFDLIDKNDRKFLFMNAFLEVMQDPIETLERLMELQPEAIVIHRQRIGDENQSELRSSYAGAIVNSSVISKESIIEIASKISDDSSVHFYQWYDEWHSIVIVK